MSTDTIPTFRAFAAVVLDLRDEQGVRGIDKERSRYHCHVEPAAFIDAPIADIKPRQIRAWLRDMAIKDAQVPSTCAPRKLDHTTINRAFSSLVTERYAHTSKEDVKRELESLLVKAQFVIPELPPDTIRDLVAVLGDEEADHVAA